MALFGSSKSAPKTIKKVKPTVVRTQNVAKELVYIAKSYGVKVETLDFNIEYKANENGYIVFENNTYLIKTDIDLVDSHMEIKYSPQEGSPEKIFGLVEVDEGEYEIQAVNRVG